MYEQRAETWVHAPPAQVYVALLDPDAVAWWRVPEDMIADVEAWEPWVGGRFRVSLSYRDPGRVGKTAGATDTYAGTFAELRPGERVVEVLGFVAHDPALTTQMRMTWTLTEVDGGTRVGLRHEGVPDAVSPADNATGSGMALAQLAAYVEGRARPADGLGTLGP